LVRRSRRAEWLHLGRMTPIVGTALPWRGRSPTRSRSVAASTSEMPVSSSVRSHREKEHVHRHGTMDTVTTSVRICRAVAHAVRFRQAPTASSHPAAHDPNPTANRARRPTM
jgi:hypothetical protein